MNNAGAGSTRNDLLRLPAVSQTDSAQLAVIGDKRNDENKIVAQMQAIMISLHNKIYEDDEFHPGIVAPNDRFANTVRLVRWHYQWVVLFDYLSGHLVMPTALSDFGSLEHPHLPLYDKVMANGREYPFMPVEFSGAVYRLGHSMVRPSYSLSANNLTKTDETTRISTFGNQGQDLRGFGEPITDNWSIDWGFFIDGVVPTNAHPDWVLPQPSYRIDTRVGHPLANLPEFQGLPPERKVEANLAYRNLSRAVGLGLPTGEVVAAALNIMPMSTSQIWSAGSRLYQDEGERSEIKSRRKAMDDANFASHFAGRTPLWFYILREAEYYGCTRQPASTYLDTPSLQGEARDDILQEDKNFGGQHLGPIGSRIVLETFLGLLWHDRKSFLHDPTWRPHQKLSGTGDLTLGKLINYVLE